MKAIKFVLMMFLALAIIQTVSAQDTARTATVVRVTGSAEVMPPQGPWTEARAGLSLPEGTVIRGKDGSKLILSIDGKDQTALVEMRGDTSLTLAEMQPAGNEVRTTLLDLAIGDVLVKVKKLPSDKSKFEIRTPISYVGVRGTIFSVSVKRSR